MELRNRIVTHSVNSPVSKMKRKITATKTSVSSRRLHNVVWCLSVFSALAFGACPYIFAGFIIVPPNYTNHFPHHRDLLNESHLYVGKITDPRHDYGYDFREVEFPSVNGAVLRGWFVPGSLDGHVVVTVHGATEDRREFLRHLPVFHNLGFSVLMFDCREHGLSDGTGRGVSYGVREHEDALAAVKYSRETLNMSTIVLAGTSQGGASSLLATAKDQGIAAVIAENPFSSVDALLDEVVPRAIRSKPKWGNHASGLGHYMTEVAQWLFPDWYISYVIRVTLWRLGANEAHSAEANIRSISPRPVLLMHGTGDAMFSYQHSQRCYDAASEPKELWLAPNALHAKLFNMYPQEWTQRVETFLKKHVLKQQ